MKRLKDNSDVPEARHGNLAKNIYKLKENDKTTTYSPVEKWVLPVASTKEPEERKFVVDSGASMHMVSKRDFTSAELVVMLLEEHPTVLSLGKLCEDHGYTDH